MAKKSRPALIKDTFEREDAAQYLLISNISFALSVGLVRLFLSLTGYPKIGSGDLHISHVLWGGLLLFIAVVIVLVFDHRLVFVLSSILSGVGIGLFIDEVGKFITTDYNYFYPAAAPIVYIFFLVILFVYLRIRHFGPQDDLNAMLQGLELIVEDLEQPLGLEKWDELQNHLISVADGPPADRKTRLAQLLLGYVQSQSRPIIKKGKQRLWWERATSAANRWLSEGHLRGLLMVGLILMGLLAWKTPVQVSPWTPPGLALLLQGSLLGEAIPAQSAPGLFAISTGMEVAMGFLFLASAGLLALKRINYGVGLGYLALILTLVTIDIAVFYFEQFSAIPAVAIQFLILLGLLDYRKRFPVSLKAAPAYLRIFIERIERGFTLRIRRNRRVRVKINPGAEK